MSARSRLSNAAHSPVAVGTLPDAPEGVGDEEYAAMMSVLIELARTDFLAYYHLFNPQGHSPFILSRLHRYLIALVQRIMDGEECPQTAVSLPPQHGKLLADSTPVLTTKGWRKHGHLKPGDYVFHPSGKPVRVMAVSAPALATVEVALSTGETIKCHERHEWVLFRDKHGPETWEAGALIEERLHRGERGGRGSRAVFQLPFVSPLAPPEANLLIDPYALGVWLGDGKSTDFTICGVDGEAFDSIPYEPSWEAVHKDTGVRYVGYAKQGLREKLRSMGLLENKRIPGEYMAASEAQRMELLAGLIDTDGSLHKPTGQYRFINANPKLVEDVVSLVYSFGWKCSVSWSNPVKSSSGIGGQQSVAQVGFTPLKPIPCRIPRKQSGQMALRRKVSVVSVRRSDTPEQGRCIQVDAPDGLYLAGRTMQPTHNSSLLSIEAPSWVLGVRPTARVAVTGFSHTLVTKFSKAIRARMESPLYQLVFPGIHPVKGSNKADEWVSTKGGGVVAKSAGSKLTGRRVDWLIMDDVHPGRAEAESETLRKKVVEWYFGDCLTRLHPTAKQFLIGTRFHPDDLIGKLTSDEYNAQLDAEGRKDKRFNYVNIPALLDEGETDVLGREPGEALFPEERPTSYLLGLKASIPSYEWDSQFQGKPRSLGSGHVDLNNIRYIDGLAKVPWDDIDEIVRGWDTALSESQSADFTAGPLVGYNRRTKAIYILNVTKRKLAWAKMRSLIIHQAEVDLKGYPQDEEENLRVLRIGIEGVGGFKGVVEDVKEALIGRVKVELKNPPKRSEGGGSKLLRAQPWLNKIEAGQVYVVRGAWTKDFIDELDQFPNCFVAGTLITTMRGDIPIESVTTDDFVLTRKGWRRVQWSGQTGVSPVVSNIGLTGTPDHPVFVVGKGWKSLHKVGKYDRLVVCGKQSHSTVTNITDTRTAPIMALRTISAGRWVREARRKSESSTAMFGSIIMDPFRKAWTYITRTAIRGTTPSTTLSACPVASISGGTGKPGRADAGCCSARSKAPQEATMLAQHAMKKTGMTSDMPQSVLKSSSGNASGAGNLSAIVDLIGRLLRGIAATIAGTTPRISASETAMPVYDLTVEDAHEFFANGVLVHNSKHDDQVDGVSICHEMLERRGKLLLA